MVCKDKDVFEQLKPAFFYWASRYKSRQFEYWELVNAAWLSNRWREVKPEYRLQAVRYAMRDYIRDETDGKRKWYLKSLGRLPPKQYSLNDVVVIAKDKSFEDFEQRDFINNALKGMSQAQRLIIKLKYIEDFTNEEIGRVIGFHSSRISQIHKNIIQLLRYKMAEN